MLGRATPSQLGAHSEAAVASALVRAGLEVFLPAFSAHGRVDLVYIDERGCIGVQCKTANLLSNDTLRFWTCSNTANTPKPYGDEVDEFGVYSPDTGMVYVLPARAVPTRSCFLRLAPTKNNQVAGVRWASDYVLGPP